MTTKRTPIDFIDVLNELLELVATCVHVYTFYGGRAGGSSFSGRLARVETMQVPGDPLLLLFEDDAAVVSLTPGRVQPFRAVNTSTGHDWLEFSVGRRRVLELERLILDEI